MLEMGFGLDKIKLLDEALSKLGTESGFNMREENSNGSSKLDILRKIEVRFNDLVEQREMAMHFDAGKIVENQETKRKKELKLRIKEEYKMAEMAENENKKARMIKKEEKFKKAGIAPGRNVAERSRKPKINKGAVKKVVEDKEEIAALKYLGYTMA